MNYLAVVTVLFWLYKMMMPEDYNQTLLLDWMKIKSEPEIGFEARKPFVMSKLVDALTNIGQSREKVESIQNIQPEVKLKVDSVDLLFYNEPNHALYLAYVSYSKHSPETSHLIVKQVEVVNSSLLQSTRMQVKDCMNVTMHGKAKKLLYYSNKLLIQTVEQNKSILHMIQEIHCSSHAHGRMIGDYSLILEYDITREKSSSIAEATVQMNYFVLSRVDGTHLVSNLFSPMMKELLPEQFGCENIHKVRSLRDKLVLLCYKTSGLLIERELVIAVTDYNNSQYQPDMRKFRVLHRDVLTGSRRWRTAQEFLAASTDIQLEESPNKEMVVLSTGTRLYSILSLRGESSSFKLRWLTTPPIGTHSLLVTDGGYVYVHTQSQGQRHQNSGDTVLLYKFDIYSEVENDASTLLLTTVLPLPFYKSVSFFKMNYDQHYIAVLDDKIGLSLHHIVMSQAYHASLRRIIHLAGQLVYIYIVLVVYDYIYSIVCTYIYRLYYTYTNSYLLYYTTVYTTTICLLKQLDELKDYK